jgi:hypothetical protein
MRKQDRTRLCCAVVDHALITLHKKSPPITTSNVAYPQPLQVTYPQPLQADDNHEFFLELSEARGGSLEEKSR